MNSRSRFPAGQTQVHVTMISNYVLCELKLQRSQDVKKKVVIIKETKADPRDDPCLRKKPEKMKPEPSEPEVHRRECPEAN